jgi:hypothetical protein
MLDEITRWLGHITQQPRMDHPNPSGAVRQQKTRHAWQGVRVWGPHETV